MSVFVIADLHLATSANKPMDIFGIKWNNHVERLRENWQTCVSPDDWVIIPGDISWGMNLAQARSDLEFIHSLNGKKIISKGNHDYWWTTIKKMNDFLVQNGLYTISFLHNNSFLVEDKIICGTRGWFVPPADEPDLLSGSEQEENEDLVLLRERQRLQVSIADGRKKATANQEIIAFLHYPPAYGDYRCDKVLEVLVEEEIGRCYYGHIHTYNPKKLVSELHGIKLELIAADYLDFTPLRIG